MGSSPTSATSLSPIGFRVRPGGQAVKTPPFHGGNTSSILVRVTKHFLRQHRYKVRCCFTKCRCGGIGRHKGLKIPRTNTPYRFKSGHRHQDSWNQLSYFLSKFSILSNLIEVFMPEFVGCNLCCHYQDFENPRIKRLNVNSFGNSEEMST